MKRLINNILNKPYKSIIFLFVFSSVFITLITSILTVPFFFLTNNHDEYEIICYLLTVLVGIIMLLIYKRWFKESYKGSFNGKIKEGLILVSPLIIIVIYNLFITSFKQDISDYFVAFTCALAPGISEEVIFRALIIPNYLRIKHSDKDIPKIATISSLLFSLMHIVNLFEGAGVKTTIIQLIYTFAIGIILAAVFLRCGSIVPSIITHTTIDYAAFLGTDVLNNGGIQKGEASTITIVLLSIISLLIIIYAYYLIRSEKRDTIKEIWKDKWNIDV